MLSEDPMAMLCRQHQLEETNRRLQCCWKTGQNGQDEIEP
jgi:hypothetical protein